MTEIVYYPLIAATFLATIAIIYFFFKPNQQVKLEEKQQEAEVFLEKAKTEALETKAQIESSLATYQKIVNDLEQKFKYTEERYQKTFKLLEDRLSVRNAENQKIEKEILEMNQYNISATDQIEQIKINRIPKLAQNAGISAENIKNELIQELKNDLELARETRLTKQEEYLKEESAQIARNHLTEAIQKYSASTSVEKKNLLIPISRDETRLRLMGNNCEILTYLEDATGVDIYFDHQKGGLTVSHFELVKRHIARETILKLLKDRVINLEKVQKRLEESTIETKKLLREIGNRVVQKLELEYRDFPDDFKEILGRLKYRTSYGQNILKHCFEVGYFTLILGGELGLNPEVCKIGGFFHDLGKAIDQEDGRPHDILTKEIMERFNIFSWEEIHAAWTHHDAIPIETAEALLVKAADAISAGRPGARQETIEKYLARIMAIETIAKSKAGVKKTYAISGGRELRVIVDPQKLKDDNLFDTANQIAEEIEANVAYPGQIKVNVIRRVQRSQTIKDKSKN